MKFSDDLFFYFCLPPIVFASGFNMQRKKFFQNIRNIILFGLIGTFIAFTSFSGMTVYYRDVLREKIYGEKGIIMEDGVTGEKSIMNLSTIEILLMCSLLCSTDVIAAISLINPAEKPKLFSLVFGEGITNDAVSIILFSTVVKYTSTETEFTASSAFSIAKDFSTLGLWSIFCGLIFGLMCSYTLKRIRTLTKSPVSECAMIFVYAYIAYVAAELWHLSGIITLLTCAVVMANYAWFNLSPQGKQSSTVIFQFVGFIAEGFVFSYLGLTFFSYKDFMWSWELIYVEGIIILIGRFLGTFGLLGFLKLFGYEKNDKRKITCGELLFIWYAGLIRGAIAFGLVLRISDDVPNRSVIVTTSLTLVVVSTIFYGSTVGLLGKCLFDKNPDPPELEEAAGEETEIRSQASYELSLPSNGMDSESSKSSVREQLLHYNQQEADDSSSSDESQAKRKRRKQPKCSDFLRRFDEMIMRPIFIYHYEKDMHNRAREFYDLFMHDGERIEKQYNEVAAQQRREEASVSAKQAKLSNHSGS